MDQIWWNRISSKRMRFWKNILKEAAEGIADCLPFRIQYHGKVHSRILIREQLLIGKSEK